MFKKILVGFDGSPGSQNALSVALQMAQQGPRALWCLAVEEKLPVYASTVGEVEEEKDRANHYFQGLFKGVKEKAQAMGVGLETQIRPGHPARTIVDFAEEGGFDLIIMGHSGSSGVWGGFLGTTTEKVTRHAHCSVLVVRVVR